MAKRQWTAPIEEDLYLQASALARALDLTHAEFTACMIRGEVRATDHPEAPPEVAELFQRELQRLRQAKAREEVKATRRGPGADKRQRDRVIRKLVRRLEREGLPRSRAIREVAEEYALKPDTIRHLFTRGTGVT